MRTLIISDIHANLPALDAVIEDAGAFGQVWCLGDVVGYGPDPNECIQRVASLPGIRCVKGNHDAAILGEIAVQAFNYEARASLRWLQSELHPENKQWLGKLPERLELEGVTLAHASPRNPVWEYIMDVSAAAENMGEFDSRVCLVGHTHFPYLFQQEAEAPDTIHRSLLPEDKPFTLEVKSILNPGSVGQPRDNDPRAAYLIFDDEDQRWTFHRVAYDIQQVQERILAAGLPQRHAARLATGW